MKLPPLKGELHTRRLKMLKTENLSPGVKTVRRRKKGHRQARCQAHYRSGCHFRSKEDGSCCIHRRPVDQRHCVMRPFRVHIARLRAEIAQVEAEGCREVVLRPDMQVLCRCSVCGWVGSLDRRLFLSRTEMKCPKGHRFRYPRVRIVNGHPVN